jgi:hypothetical protein
MIESDKLRVTSYQSRFRQKGKHRDGTSRETFAFMPRFNSKSAPNSLLKQRCLLFKRLSDHSLGAGKKFVP